MPERVAIIGSRGFPNLGLVRQCVQSLPANTEVVSGGAYGVDAVAADEAASRGLAVRVFPADWRRYGRRAGPLRNRTIVEYADRIIAFWDGTSRGTANVIALAQALGKPCEIATLDTRTPREG